MWYAMVKWWVRLALQFFAVKITITKPELLEEDGPLLLACNHPNSFLDAMLIGDYFKNPVHFVTRGDVFKNQMIRKLFSTLQMIPIYRKRDGKDKLALNNEAFSRSVDALRKNELLLIFVEGFCINQTTLQLPLKKGAPRILQTCWEQDIPARVLPVWLQYSSLTSFGKIIEIRPGEIFSKELVKDMPIATGITKINVETEKQLLHLSAMPFIPLQPGMPVRVLLFLPAIAGIILHAPFYLPVQMISARFTKGNVHYDSVLFAALTLGYPLYLLVMIIILHAITGYYYVWTLLAIMPLLAKAYLHWKNPY
jgi:1-acyl-sn-glycerol-3-phosphate acyltransferase